MADLENVRLWEPERVNPDISAPPEADIAQDAFPIMGAPFGDSPVQEHPRMLQKDPRVL